MFLFFQKKKKDFLSLDCAKEFFWENKFENCMLTLLFFIAKILV